MKKNNIKGFTLIELLGILVVLSIIGLITFVAITSIIKKGREDALDKQLNYIILAAKNYMSDHSDELPGDGYSISVPLGALKIGGYVDMEVKNPNTKKCFKNTLIVTVTKNWGSVNYDYTISRENGNIDTDDSCSIGDSESSSDIYFRTPDYIGELATQEATIFYYKSVSDTTAREKIKSYIEWTTVSEMRTDTYGSTLTIYEEQSETNGYSRKIKIDTAHSVSLERQDKLYLYADNGFITTDSGDETSRVTSNPIKIMGAPNINIYDGEIMISSSTETKKLSNNSGHWSVIAENNFCTNFYSQTMRFNTDMEKGIHYSILDTDGKIIHELNLEDGKGKQDVYFSVVENTNQPTKNIKYQLKACYFYGEDFCVTKDLQFNKRDCLMPDAKVTVTIDDSLDHSLTIADLFDDTRPAASRSETDVYSGLDYAYAFIHPSSDITNFSITLDDQIYDFSRIYKGYMDVNRELDSSIATVSGGIPIKEYTLNTQISTIMTDATEKDTFCLNKKYVYLVVKDKADNINTFRIGTINGLPDDCNGNKGTFIEDRECHNDSYICDMIRNSQSWFSRKLTDEDKSKLHNENAEICFKNNSNCYYGNGKWYDCSNGYCTDLYTHTQTTVSSDDLEYVTTQF